MYIKGTDRIRGVLDLNTIGVQISKGSRFPVTEEQLHDSNVQTALHMGYITKEGGPKSNTGGKEKKDRTVRCLNMHSRPISLEDVNQEIAPRAEFDLKESDLKKPHIKRAIDKQLIQVLQVVGSDSDYSETFVKLGNLFEEQQSDELEEKQKEAEDFVKSLETNEELEVSTKVIEEKNVVDTENPAPVKQSEVKDPKRAHVIWNPANNPVINEMKNAQVREKEKDIDDILFADGEKEVPFADKEVEAQRKEDHPTLKDNDIRQNSEVDFIDNE